MNDKKYYIEIILEMVIVALLIGNIVSDVTTNEISKKEVEKTSTIESTSNSISEDNIIDYDIFKRVIIISNNTVQVEFFGYSKITIDDNVITIKVKVGDAIYRTHKVSLNENTNYIIQDMSSYKTNSPYENSIYYYPDKIYSTDIDVLYDDNDVKEEKEEKTE